MSTNIEIEIIKKINENTKDDNFIISPIGIEILLSLCSNGAEGETQNEILKFLNYKNLETANKESKRIINQFNKNKDILSVANAILTKEKAKEEFIYTAITEYEAKIEELKNYQQVNTWAKNKTKNNIIKIIDSISPNTLMILLNAIYFEALWTKKFDINDNSQKEFKNFGIESEKVITTMMNLNGVLLNYYENKYFQSVKLNYESKNKSTHSIIILPQKKITLDNLINIFNNEMYEELIEGLNKKESKVNIFLPKFELEYKIDLCNILYDLGIRKAFTKDAEFKKICKRPPTDPIHIGQILQKNYMNVNEKGTQAASVTELTIILECYKDKTSKGIDFICDKPFLFLIRNENFPKGHDILFATKFCKIEDFDDY